MLARNRIDVIDLNNTMSIRHPLTQQLILPGINPHPRSFERLAAQQSRDERKQLSRWIQQVRGRGACRHPDGAAAFATSALKVFARESELHLRGRCEGKRRVLPIPGIAA